jgi:hypothetical protein
MKRRVVLLWLLGAVLCGAAPTWSDSTSSPATSHDFTNTDIFMKPTDSSDLVSASNSEPSSGRYDSFSSHAWQQLGNDRDRDNLTIVSTPQPALASLRLTESTCLTVLGSGMLMLGGLGFRRRRATLSADSTVATESCMGGSLDQIVRLSKSQT